MSKKVILMFVFCMLLSTTAFAAETGMVWETPLQKIADSLTGPVPKLVGLIVIVGAGITLAMGDHGAITKRLLQAVIGLAIALFASSVMSSLFGASAGATVDLLRAVGAL